MLGCAAGDEHCFVGCAAEDGPTTLLSIALWGSAAEDGPTTVTVR